MLGFLSRVYDFNLMCNVIFFFIDPATPEIYTYGHPLSLHDSLPIYENDVNGRFYTDLTLRWDFGTAGKSYELAASVTNLFDVDPPIVPTRASVYPSQTNGLLYDTLGRRFTLTFRFKL